MSYTKQGKKQDNNGNHNQRNQQSRGNNNNNTTKKWTNNNINTSNRNNHASSHEPIIQDAATVKLMHDRMIFLLASLTGSLVEVTVKDGSKFKGVFHGASTEGDLGIALKLAQKIHDPLTPLDKDKTNANPLKNILLIFSKDLVEINAVQVDLNIENSIQDRNTFKTDTDISGKLDIKERELHKWAPAEDDNALGLLEDDFESKGEAWDQFAANEKLFGLKTDFNEEIYTTHLNRSAPGFKDREKRAIKMANEIQKSSTNNIHILEERGIVVDDSGMDEEDLYGAVVRENTSNKYVPPALRKQRQPAPPAQKAPPKKEGKMGPLNKLITSDLPKASGATLSPIAHLPTNRREPNTDKPDKQKARPDSADPPKTIETQIATTFRHFAMMEKDKLHAKKQALQKKEKDGRLAELKAFHQSFKLNVPIPADLVPLLSKGKKEEKPKEDPKTFKFNVKASSFKPNPSAVAFVPGESHKQKPEILTMAQAFSPSFLEKELPASAVGPTWPFGHKSYRVQFSQFTGFEEDVFTGYPSPGYAYGYAPYRYPQYAMPQMAVQQSPYPFVQNVPISAPIPTAGPPSVGYSPQMANVSPHGSPFPQGFPSPQRSPMVPPGMAPQIYQYQGGPMMMRYPPEMIQASGPPVMLPRPVMVESMQYHHQDTSDSGTETPPN